MRNVFRLVAAFLGFFLCGFPVLGQTTPFPVKTKTPAQILSDSGPMVALIVSTDGDSTSLGTGFLVGDGSLLVTNFHVVKGTKKLVVKLANGRIFEVKRVVGFDAQKDIAILKIVPGTEHGLQLGDSDTLQVGEPVVVISNPEGLEHTVSNGLISGIRRLEKWPKILQISAPISPGSSGGPVFNERGQVVGIVCFYLEGDQNLNFAIPINFVKELLSKNADVPLSELSTGSKNQKSLPSSNLPAATGSENSLPVGTAILTLGMTESLARSRLRSYSLESSGDPSLGDFLIVTPGEPPNSIGTVQFQQGKVVAVNRFWVGDPAQSFAGLVLSEIVQMGGSCHSQLSIKTKHFAFPDSTITYVEIRCGKWSLSISSDSDVSESVIAPKDR